MSARDSDADRGMSTKRAAMARVRTRDTGPELVVRSALHRSGYRFRTHAADLPGKPDILLPRHRLAIFVHGCFWHGHIGCGRAGIPKTRPDFWKEKIRRNQDRDQVVLERLADLGWRTLVVWSCETVRSAVLVSRLQQVLDMNRLGGPENRRTGGQPAKSRRSTRK
jgi:DNA mismatch endonuclease, patch repair protein